MARKPVEVSTTTISGDGDLHHSSTIVSTDSSQSNTISSIYLTGYNDCVGDGNGGGDGDVDGVGDGDDDVFYMRIRCFKKSDGDGDG